LGWRLRSARLGLGARQGRTVSQEEFAKLVQDTMQQPFHQTRLSRIESNAAEPTLPEAMACAIVASVSVTWLLYGIDVPLSAGANSLEAYTAWIEQYRGAHGDTATDALTSPTPPPEPPVASERGKVTRLRPAKGTKDPAPARVAGKPPTKASAKGSSDDARRPRRRTGNDR
jgi:transcriptional regulator with XRE-family HTH domain